jgi:hypothetical protein
MATLILTTKSTYRSLCAQRLSERTVQGNRVNSNTPEPHRKQQDHPAACVDAQQYSSATIISSCFYSRKEAFGASFKEVFLFTF